MFLVNLVATVALARNLVGLLHSNSAEKSNKTVKPATVLQYSTENYTSYKPTVFYRIPLHYITNT